MKVKVAQLCLTLCDPVDCSLPSFSVHRILQARILEWVAVSFSRGISHSGMEPGAPALQADSLLSEPPGKPRLGATPSKELERGKRENHRFVKLLPPLRFPSQQKA